MITKFTQNPSGEEPGQKLFQQLGQFFPEKFGHLIDVTQVKPTLMRLLEVGKTESPDGELHPTGLGHADEVINMLFLSDVNHLLRRLNTARIIIRDSPIEPRPQRNIDN